MSRLEFCRWQKYRNEKLKEVEKQDYYLARIIYLLSFEKFKDLNFEDCFIKFEDDEQEKKDKEQLMSGSQLLVSLVMANVAQYKGKLYKNMTVGEKEQFQKDVNGN